MKIFQLYGSWAQLTNYQYLIFIKQGNALPYPHQIYTYYTKNGIITDMYMEKREMPDKSNEIKKERKVIKTALA